MKTKRIKIAVAIDSTGDWSASSWNPGQNQTQDEVDKHAMEICLDGLSGGNVESQLFVYAEVPIPEEIEVEGEVVENTETEG